MKTLFSRLVLDNSTNYQARYERLRDAFTGLTKSRWEDPSNSAVFLAGGSARENHDRLRLVANLRDDDMLCIIDHAEREICCSGAPNLALLEFLATCSGYKMVGSNARILAALMAKPPAARAAALSPLPNAPR